MKEIYEKSKRKGKISEKMLTKEIREDGKELENVFILQLKHMQHSTMLCFYHTER